MQLLSIIVGVLGLFLVCVHPFIGIPVMAAGGLLYMKSIRDQRRAVEADRQRVEERRHQEQLDAIRASKG